MREQAHRFGQHTAFDVAALADEVFGAVGMGDAFDILMVATPLDETTTRIWKVNVFAADTDAARFAAFSRAAMLQDQAIVESQSPQRLPLDPRAEFSLGADRLALAYRRWLRGIGLTYGVIA